MLSEICRLMDRCPGLINRQKEMLIPEVPQCLLRPADYAFLYVEFAFKEGFRFRNRMNVHMQLLDRSHDGVNNFFGQYG